MDFGKQHAEQIRDLLLDLTGSWSANAVVKVMSSMDLGIRRQDALALIRGYIGKGDRDRRYRTNQLTFLMVPEPSREPSAEPSREPTERSDLKGIVYISSWLRHSASSVTSFPASANGAGAREEKFPEWVMTLAHEFTLLQGRELRKYSRAERHVLGRVHALLFANFRVAEPANVAKGASIAAQIASMARSAEFRDLTGAEYVRLGIRALQMRRGRPFHSAWDIRAGADLIEAKP